MTQTKRQRRGRRKSPMGGISWLSPQGWLKKRGTRGGSLCQKSIKKKKLIAKKIKFNLMLKLRWRSSLKSLNLPFSSVNWSRKVPISRIIPQPRFKDDGKSQTGRQSLFLGIGWPTEPQERERLFFLPESGQYIEEERIGGL